MEQKAKDEYIKFNNKELEKHGIKMGYKSDFERKRFIYPIAIFLGLLAIAGSLFYLGYFDKLKIETNVSNNQTCPIIPSCPEMKPQSCVCNCISNSSSYIPKDINISLNIYNKTNIS